MGFFFVRPDEPGRPALFDTGLDEAGRTQRGHFWGYSPRPFLRPGSPKFRLPPDFLWVAPGDSTGSSAGIVAGGGRLDRLPVSGPILSVFQEEETKYGDTSLLSFSPFPEAGFSIHTPHSVKEVPRRRRGVSPFPTRFGQGRARPAPMLWRFPPSTCPASSRVGQVLFPAPLPSFL